MVATGGGVYEVGRKYLLGYLTKEASIMGDEHDRVEAMWDEAGRPSLEELEAELTLQSIRPVQAAYPCNSYMRGYTGTRCERCGRPLSEHMLTKNDWYEAKQQSQIGGQVSRREQLAQELAASKAAQIRLEERLARFAKFPEDDPYVDGDVIVFEKQYGTRQVMYRYVAARIKGQYYLTGEVTGSMNWTKLVEFMNQGGTVNEVWLLEKSRELFTGRYHNEEKAATPE